MKYLLFILIILISLAACTSSQPEQTSTPLPPTEPPPPTEQSKKEVVKYGVVTFDGTECTVSGPSEVQTGYYSFELIDTSGLNVGMWPVRLENGKTFQDLLDGQSEPGEWYPQPVWVIHPFYFTDEQQLLTTNLNKPGEHALDVGSDTPQSLWFCGPPFQVVEVSSAPITESETESDWPENIHFCRAKEDGTSDCWHLTSAEVWLELEPIVGERIPTWPEFAPLPPLPEGMEWEYLRDSQAGEYMWTIVEGK